MNLEDVSAIKWQKDGISVPFESFHELCTLNGFKHMFTYPFGANPQVAIAARTLEELNRIIAPIQKINNFNF